MYFDDFKRLYEVRARSPQGRRRAAAPGPDRAGAAQGEKYVNPGKVETESQVANNAGKIGGDWKPNSPPKKKCAPAPRRPNAALARLESACLTPKRNAVCVALARATTTERSATSTITWRTTTCLAAGARR